MRAALLLALVLTLGCAATHEASPDGAAGASGLGGASGAGGGFGPLILPPIPDDGYMPANIGGYLLGSRELQPAEIQGTLPATSSTGCQKLRGIVRDFKGALPAMGGSLQPGGHPDFEVFEGKGVTPGLVGATLGDDRKPLYTGTCQLPAPVSKDCPFGAMTTSEEAFKQWYSSVQGVNRTYFVYFQLSDPMQGVSTFSSDSFFPLDGAGFGDSGTLNNGVMHNFSFTTEIHTKFRYSGGETFRFEGDDDVWIFINGKLAVDLGGLHEKTLGSVALDDKAATLGIETGQIYSLDLFHAERHSVASDFHIDMRFNFTDCGYIIP